jgi:hypothetical protein
VPPGRPLSPVRRHHQLPPRFRVVSGTCTVIVCLSVDLVMPVSKSTTPRQSAPILVEPQPSERSGDAIPTEGVSDYNRSRVGMPCRAISHTSQSCSTGSRSTGGHQRRTSVRWPINPPSAPPRPRPGRRPAGVAHVGSRRRRVAQHLFPGHPSEISSIPGDSDPASVGLTARDLYPNFAPPSEQKRHGERHDELFLPAL